MSFTVLAEYKMSIEKRNKRQSKMTGRLNQRLQSIPAIRVKQMNRKGYLYLKLTPAYNKNENYATKVNA